MIKIHVDVDWNDRALEIGSADVWLEGDRDETYLGTIIGRKAALGSWLDLEGFYGLGDYVRSLKAGPIAYLAGMEVRQELMGRKVGSELMRGMIEAMKREGITTIVLHRSGNVWSSDKDLKRFYSRFGFEDVDCCSRDLWPVMRLDLEDNA